MPIQRINTEKYKKCKTEAGETKFPYKEYSPMLNILRINLYTVQS